MSTSIPDSGQAVITAPATSPSVIRRMRASVARSSASNCSWRGRSNTTTVRSSTPHRFAWAMRFRFSSGEASTSIAPFALGPTAIFCMYTNGPGSNMLPRSATATVASAFARPSASNRVPSMGSTAISTSGGFPVPSFSPLNSIGASSFSPSPIMTVPSISMLLSISLIASTAASSLPFLSLRPIKRPAASAAVSVTRTSSSARLRSGSQLVISLLLSVLKPLHAAASRTAQGTPEYPLEPRRRQRSRSRQTSNDQRRTIQKM